MIEGHLKANGVTVVRGGSSPTSTAIATLGPEDGATYAFDISWDINGTSVAALAAVESSTHVHTGSIAAVLGPGDQATHGLLKAAREGDDQTPWAPATPSWRKRTTAGGPAG
ncbi:hypothetical protein QK290_17265 [Pseudarthrobacter sp. AL07]|uniref:hypothetical protein n=1 Tax=unclassified Pseudarthrobacter TaxID=2647000 RepID=UPI00249B89FA|nr:MULTISPECIES: hypothetical protein [unclassified Pseudarthrobacter]MDI3196138.1 hypothetical protein [Pseudarthrobacter sp. AL20]MDI3210209.1 hypothetical protein [Pseudarthrobacter sp. AL07]